MLLTNGPQKALLLHGLSLESQLEPAPEGPTNLELLEHKEPASVMYLLDALQRFENMETWDNDNLLGWALRVRRDSLEQASPEDVALEYEALSGDLGEIT